MLRDFELLAKLYEIHSPSNREKKMRKFVKRACIERGASVVQDKTGNLYVTKGESDTYPCIVAHLDQVQDNHSKDFNVYMQGDIIFAYSAKSKAQQGLGADDKNGIWVALQLLEELDVLKCAFFVGEEVGCVGSSEADMDFFKNVRYCVQPDRRNGHDLITDISGDICSKEFLDATCYADFGYAETSGLMTDVETLCTNGIGVSCINISCGYYHPHTDDECTSWSELNNALNFARHICTTLLDVYPHKYENKWANYKWNDYKWGGYGYGYGCGDDYRDWYDTPSRKLYSPEDEDADYEVMDSILSYESHLTFEEVMQYYGESDVFNTKNRTTLRRIYDDCMSMNGNYDTNDEPLEGNCVGETIDYSALKN